MSPTMTTAAPRRWQDAAHARPTGPAPATYTMEPGRENIGQQREILDLRHCFVFVGELHQVEVCVGNQYIFCLAADPSTHVHITVCRTRTRRIHGQTDAGLAFATVTAAAAGDVEGN